jgi:hypothetical protein
MVPSEGFQADSRIGPSETSSTGVLARTMG